jgi:hypothetical protein
VPAPLLMLRRKSRRRGCSSAATRARRGSPVSRGQRARSRDQGADRSQVFGPTLLRLGRTAAWLATQGHTPQEGPAAHVSNAGGDLQAVEHEQATGTAARPPIWTGPRPLDWNITLQKAHGVQISASRRYAACCTDDRLPIRGTLPPWLCHLHALPSRLVTLDLG